MIRVPYFGEEFVDDPKDPDERELQKVDTIFNIKRENIVRIRTGPPIILQDLVEPELR